MFCQNNKLIIRRYIEEVLNTGNLDIIGNFISSDYAEVYEGKRYELGVEGAKSHVLGVRSTYPDLILTIDQQIAEGEWVVTSQNAVGTHMGNWLGIKPTGKKVHLTGVNIDKVVNNLITEHSGAANLLEPLLGIGAIQVVGNIKNDSA